MKNYPNIWQKKSLLSYLLLPASGLYRLIIVLRKWLYKKTIKKTVYFSVPVIVVGNITIGGTGKTPLVSWLVKFLRENGWHPGIVSRGYGGKAQIYPQEVSFKSKASEVGDEPLLLARQTMCPVIVDPQRVRAVRTLLETKRCDVVVSDDGLQHYALGRDLEIAVVDGKRRYGNTFCLPAGPLREPQARLKKVDFIVVNQEKNETHTNIDTYTMCYQFEKLHRVNNPQTTQTFQDFQKQTVHAVAGIGNPQRFFQTLREFGLEIIEHVFPDHFNYKPPDLQFADEGVIIMTEKDAVKCMNFANDKMWYLPISAVPDAAFIRDLRKRLSQLREYALPI